MRHLGQHLASDQPERRANDVTRGTTVFFHNSRDLSIFFPQRFQPLGIDDSPPTSNADDDGLIRSDLVKVFDPDLQEPRICRISTANGHPGPLFALNELLQLIQCPGFVTPVINAAAGFEYGLILTGEFPEVDVQTGSIGVDVGIDDARYHRFSSQVYFGGPGTGQSHNLIVVAYRQNGSVSHRHRLGHRVSGSYRQHNPVVQDQIRIVKNLLRDLAKNHDGRQHKNSRAEFSELSSSRPHTDTSLIHLGIF